MTQRDPEIEHVVLWRCNNPARHALQVCQTFLFAIRLFTPEKEAILSYHLLRFYLVHLFNNFRVVLRIEAAANRPFSWLTTNLPLLQTGPSYNRSLLFFDNDELIHRPPLGYGQGATWCMSITKNTDWK